MKRSFVNEWEKAEFYARRAMFWSKVSILFAVIALTAVIVGAFIRANL